ncbi:Per1-like protein [Serendipita vermifera]|nr:Per1-like protein [Serendipita vermifera]
MRHVWAWLALFFSLVLNTDASSGDRAPAYQWCLAQRLATQCHPVTQFSSRTPSWQTLSLQLTHWSCEDNCKYHCAHLMTDEAIHENRRIEQYYGKWAFWRLFGMQEPASVLFSLGNLWAHVTGGRRLQRGLKSGHPMKPFYMAFTLSSINLWIWSAVFHTRDKPWTEKLDYFSAAFAMLCGIFYTIVRLYHLYDAPVHRTLHPFLIPWATLCIALFLAHVTYLTVILPRFDYGWNMKVNITAGLLYSLLWMAYSLPSPPFSRFKFVRNRDYRPDYAGLPLLLGVGMITAACLEVFDFPPWWRVIDAHSLWHLATIPIVLGWYRFQLLDGSDPAWDELRRRKYE